MVSSCCGRAGRGATAGADHAVDGVPGPLSARRNRPAVSDTGRAGKIRVERRLLTARHGALLLDRKRHIMVNELERLQLHAGRSRQEWEDRAREAAVWLQRAAALDGRERAVEKRWIPRLENELLAIRRQLDEQELEESLRLRWAADRNETTTGPL